MTRLQTLRDQGKAPELPPPGPGVYLVDYLFEAGPVTANAMGPQPLGWSDLAAWQASVGVALQPWELRALKRLSTVYLASAQAAQAYDCPPPWSTEPAPDERAHISRALSSIFKSLTRTH